MEVVVVMSLLENSDGGSSSSVSIVDESVEVEQMRTLKEWD